jgi:hypothetical protein
MTDKPNPKPHVTLPGTVEKIIKPADPREPEKAQISIEGADDLYRELRIENKLTTDSGTETRLKDGAEVDVTVEANPKGTNPANKKPKSKDRS